MSRYKLPLLTASLLVTFAGAAFANDADFKLHNKTGYTIDEVYVSRHSNSEWGKDIMGKDSLDDGEVVNISFPHGGSSCHYDIMVKYHDGDKAEVDDVNLCNYEKITLHWTGKRTTFEGE